MVSSYASSLIPVNYNTHKNSIWKEKIASNNMFIFSQRNNGLQHLSPDSLHRKKENNIWVLIWKTQHLCLFIYKCPCIQILYKELRRKEALKMTDKSKEIGTTIFLNQTGKNTLKLKEIPSQTDWDILGCPQNQLSSSQFHHGHIPAVDFPVAVRKKKISSCTK